MICFKCGERANHKLQAKSRYLRLTRYACSLHKQVVSDQMVVELRVLEKKAGNNYYPQVIKAEGFGHVEILHL